MEQQTVQLPAAARQTACMRRQPPPVPMDCTATVTRPVTVLDFASQELLLPVMTVSAVLRISAMKLMIPV
jgi:hypothetical protein